MLKINTPGKEIRFGVVSDTHLCADTERLEELAEAYDIFSKEGIDKVFHAGDITDGFNVYKGHEQHVKIFGTEKQAVYTIRHYPRIRGKTFFITGNHDLRAFEKGGEDVGSLIVNGVTAGKDDEGVERTAGRDDLVYLGRFLGRIVWNNNKIDIVHPDYGFSYAVSYAPQKYINELEPGTKPDVLIFGHLHRAFYMNYRNINLLMAGCFQGQNDYLKRKGIQPVRAAWIVEIKRDRKFRLKFTPHLLKFY